MDTYEVPVRNELTGEEVLQQVQADCHSDAQINALLELFKGRGWRKATALEPQPVRP